MEEGCHSSRFSLKVLRSRLARQANLSRGDPLMASAAALVTGAESQRLTLSPEAQPSTSWGELLDAVGPLDMGGHGLAATPPKSPPTARRRIRTQVPSSFSPLSGWEAQPTTSGAGQAYDGHSSLAAVDLDLQDVCQHATAKVNIQWPQVQAELVRSHYDGKKLPKAKRKVKQLMPLFTELLDEPGAPSHIRDG